MKNYFLLIPVFLIAACSGNSHSNKNIADSTNNKPVVITDSVAKQDTDFDYTNTVLQNDFTDTIYHIFSDSLSKDRFSFSVPKGNINKTKAILIIRDAHGNVLYADVFTTADMINGYDLYEIKNETQMEAYILEHAKQMLDTSSFEMLSSATEENDANVIDTNVYDECEQEKRPLFRIGLHEEDVVYYGYSYIKKKVVEVWECC